MVLPLRSAGRRHLVEIRTDQTGTDRRRIATKPSKPTLIKTRVAGSGTSPERVLRFYKCETGYLTWTKRAINRLQLSA